MKQESHQTSLPSHSLALADWYNEVVYKADLCDTAPVRGCIVVKPYGYAIWELIQAYLDKRIKATGHSNVAFPLLIPYSFLQKEAQHVEGFSPELAVVTHAGGEELAEPLVVRPTSETVMYDQFARWIHSWRDLPLKVNQWCSVVRWEKRTRPFLRTTEFWWQEGHTAHETYGEAEAEAQQMLEEYCTMARTLLAIPVIPGIKPDSEKFAGAEKTLTFEGIMPDGKALQMGTSHMLSQSFAQAFQITFQDRNGALAYPHLTSWGTTTRLIGAAVMVHGDDKGLILPPRIAPIQVVIIPIVKEATKQAVMARAQEISNQLQAAGIRVHLDDRAELMPGAKYYHWELKGVPLRIELGMRDLEQGLATVVDRLTGIKKPQHITAIASCIQEGLDVLHEALLARATQRRDAAWHKAEKLSQFGPLLEQHNGVYQAGWCGDRACDAKVRDYKATIRCLVPEGDAKHCLTCDKPSISDILVAKAY
jgi:prolyl-tRNA synthetase